MKVKVRITRKVEQEAEVEIEVPSKHQFCVDDIENNAFEIGEARREEIYQMIVEKAQESLWNYVKAVSRAGLPHIAPIYDPSFGDTARCICGHYYYRHFDGYDDNAPVGCKYCPCDFFIPQDK
jgi:hypothetical protein